MFDSLLRAFGRQLQQVFADGVHVHLRKLVRRHDAVLDDRGRIGEVLFEPGAIVTGANAIQSRAKRSADTADLMASVAMVLLIDGRALGHEGGCG